MKTRTHETATLSPRTEPERPATLDITVDVHRPMRFPDGMIGYLAIMLIENNEAKLAPNARIVLGECQCGSQGLVIANTAMFEIKGVDYNAAMQTMADLQDPAMPQVRIISPHAEPAPITLHGQPEDSIAW